MRQARAEARRRSRAHLRELATLVPFAGCTMRDLAEIDRLAHPVHVETGTVFTEEGGLGDQVYVVVRGEVEVSIAGRTVTTVRRSGWVGETAMLAGRPRTATARAVTEVDVLAFDIDALAPVAPRMRWLASDMHMSALEHARELVRLSAQEAVTG
ncbi:MAG TPA: cyclic nucleotide-binding domain-containing protein [Acidimicrobiales bacterium]|nr:cyclic nucleotide-binding domain-containing protein [Acidimicrobiales bacterium]